MPIKIPDNLPAVEVLRNENIFIMQESFAQHQDIRPLSIVLLNLMPKKIETEIHLLRLLSNTPLQVEIQLMRIHDKPSKSTPIEHMETFYKNFHDIKDSKFDGMIITGAPLGLLDFSEVSFWEDMKEIMDWTITNVTSVMYLCWAVHAAFYHLYGIPKFIRDKKISGVYSHYLNNPLSPIVRGFDDIFYSPHSRNGEVRSEDIRRCEELEIISESEIAGPNIVVKRDGRQLFISGHSEYEPLCLKDEYERDLKAGINPAIPENYFPDDDPSKDPIVTWKCHGNLLFSNWLNYYVYQLTPYDISDVGTVIKRSN